MSNSGNGDNSIDRSRMKRSAEEAWRLDRELIREISAREIQEENDRILAKKIGGLPVERIPDSVREMAIISNNFDDDDDRTRGTEGASTEQTSSTGKKR